MKRYRGESLLEASRIAIVTNDSLGNYVVSTPLLQMLRSTHQPSTLHIYSGPKTEELWSHDPNIDWGFPFSGIDPDKALIHAKGSYDLIVNLEASMWAKDFTRLLSREETYISGPCLQSEGNLDLPFGSDCRGKLAANQDWIADDLEDRFPCLQSPFIGEIFCRTSYLEGTVPPCSVPEQDPSMAIPDVLISTTASLPQKLWQPEKWVKVCQWLVSQGFSIGIIGAKPEDQRRYWFGEVSDQAILESVDATDLRGKLLLPEVAGALRKSKLCLTIDNGLLHVASSVGAPTVGFFRSGYSNLWAPRVDNLQVLTPEKDALVQDIECDQVILAVQTALG